MVVISLIVMLTTNTVQKCKRNIYQWIETSSIFYLTANVICLSILVSMKRALPRVQTVNLGLVLCLFVIHRDKWPYVVLTFIDLIHISLTIWGYHEFFYDLPQIVQCYMEIPILTNFMFILLVVGFMFFFRFLVTVFHFWFGPAIWLCIRRRCPCFRRLDPPTLRAKFPLYLFQDYQLYLRDMRSSLGQDPLCPICCEQYGADTIITLLTCNQKHIYHPRCIREWLVEHRECPLCKVNVY